MFSITNEQKLIAGWCQMFWIKYLLVQPDIISLWLSYMKSFWTITQFSLPCLVERHTKGKRLRENRITLPFLRGNRQMSLSEKCFDAEDCTVVSIFTVLDDCIKLTPPSAFSAAPRPAGNYSICKRSNIVSPKLLIWSRENNFRAIYYPVLWQLLSQLPVTEICFYSYDLLSKYNACGYKNALHCFLWVIRLLSYF